MRPSSTLSGPSAIQNLQRILDGNISFGMDSSNEVGKNIDGWDATGTTPGVADTEFSISHGLGRIPKGFIVLSVNAGVVIYKSTTAWTSKVIYLKCSGPSVAYTLFIV